MQQHGSKYLTRRPPPPPDPGGGAKIFRTWSYCISNLIESRIQHHASTYSVLTHTLDPWGRVKGQYIFFSESSHVAYQIRREWIIEHHAITYTVLTHTQNLWVG